MNPTPPASDRETISALVAKQEIAELLYRRARASDRRDLELALSCYHPGATESHEGFDGPAADFVGHVSIISPESKAPVTCLWHSISNILIELRGDTAAVESYHIAVVVREDDSGPTHSSIGGRYLDQVSFQDGRWAVEHRDVVFDWSRVEPTGQPYWDLVGLDESKLLRGRFGRDDPLYAQLHIDRGRREA